MESYDGEKIEVFLISPKEIGNNAPCFAYLHGGGFVLAAAGYHYKNAMYYAKESGCKVLFVNYRLAPKHPHPVFFEDCYAAFCWAYDNAERLGKDGKTYKMWIEDETSINESLASDITFSVSTALDSFKNNINIEIIINVITCDIKVFITILLLKSIINLAGP